MRKKITSEQEKLCNLAYMIDGISFVDDYLKIIDIEVTQRSAYRYVTDKEAINNEKRISKKYAFSYDLVKGISIRKSSIKHKIHTQLACEFIKELENE